MSIRLRHQIGFTLIEALIAFVVLTVGILGTLLFHSALLKESGDNKTRLEAIKIAEDWIENRRSLGLTSSAYVSNIASLSAGSTTVSGTNAFYNLAWDSATLASGALSDIYKVDLTVSWADGNQPVELSTYFGYLDPDNTIRPEDAADGGSGGGYAGSIKVPTGTLRELPRIEIANGAISAAIAAGEFRYLNDPREDIVIYKEEGEAKVAVQIDDNTFVQLAQLQNFENEILTITGRVYLSQDADHRVSEIFGPIYGVSAASASDTQANSVDPFYRYDSNDIQLLDDGLYWLNNIIDMRASAGASCVIGRFGNFYEGGEYKRGYYGDYICVAGTGWNGSIKPYHRQYYLDSTRGSFGSRDIEIDGLVCGPALRSYRYYTLSVSDLESFDDDIASVGVSMAMQTAIDNANATVVGQSGLVRFYKNESDLTNSTSGEGVLWDSFFWHNPNFVISPNQTSGFFSLTPSVAAPSPFIFGGDASTGYKAPKVTNVSSIDHQVQFSGDVAHQNFYIADPSSGGNRWDCDDVWDSFTFGGARDTDYTFTTANTGSIYPNQGSTVTASYELHGHLVDYGLPGFTGNIAYYPEYSDSSLAAEEDYNNYSADLSTGAIVLGYTLATESVSGNLTFRSDLASVAQFALGGNPEPVISVDCYPDLTSLTETVSPALSTYNFTCSVPKNWSGTLFAFHKDKTQIACNSLESAVSSAVPSGDLLVTTENIDDIVTAVSDNESIRYFFEATDGLNSVSSAASQFKYLVTAERNLSLGENTEVNFEFGSGVTCSSSP